MGTRIYIKPKPMDLKNSTSFLWENFRFWVDPTFNAKFEAKAALNYQIIFNLKVMVCFETEMFFTNWFCLETLTSNFFIRLKMIKFWLIWIVVKLACVHLLREKQLMKIRC